MHFNLCSCKGSNAYFNLKLKYLMLYIYIVLYNCSVLYIPYIGNIVTALNILNILFALFCALKIYHLFFSFGDCRKETRGEWKHTAKNSSLNVHFL